MAMLGSLNKLLRNVASLQGKSAFDKTLIKATYSGDTKEPKEKHLIFVLECIKGKHLELIRPKEALTKLFDRFFNNLRSFSLMIKSLIILHRALQEEDISQLVAHKIKEKENLLFPTQAADQTQETRNQVLICELYISYIKNLVSFIIICQLFSISLKDLQHYTKSLQHQELFLIFSRIDGLIESILKVFGQKAYCQTQRVLQSLIYLVFVDLLQIYQSYYLLITVMLEKFNDMSVKDSKKAFIIYMNFMKINKEIRKMALCIIQEFNIKMGIQFYEIDVKVVEALKLAIELKEKANSPKRGNSSTLLSGESGTSIDEDGIVVAQNYEAILNEDLFAPPDIHQLRRPTLERGKTMNYLTKASPLKGAAAEDKQVKVLNYEHQEQMQGFQSSGKDKRLLVDNQMFGNHGSAGMMLGTDLQGRQGVQQRKLSKQDLEPVERRQQQHDVPQHSRTQQFHVTQRQARDYEADRQRDLYIPDFQRQTEGESTQHRVKGLQIQLHEVSLLSDDTLGMISKDNEEEKDYVDWLGPINQRKVQQPDEGDIMRMKSRDYLDPRVLQPKQPILISKDSTSSGRSRSKGHSVKFAEEFASSQQASRKTSDFAQRNPQPLLNTLQQRRESKNSSDDDIDQFKSIMVKDDLGFFQALEPSPKNTKPHVERIKLPRDDDEDDANIAQFSDPQTTFKHIYGQSPSQRDTGQRRESFNQYFTAAYPQERRQSVRSANQTNADESFLSCQDL